MPKDRRDRIDPVRKRAGRTAELAGFVSALGRKTRRNGLDPNDRDVDPALARRLRKVPPIEFDRILRDDED